jgi:hypothetical protein
LPTALPERKSFIEEVTESLKFSLTVNVDSDLTD